MFSVCFYLFSVLVTCPTVSRDSEESSTSVCCGELALQGRQWIIICSIIVLGVTVQIGV